MNDGPRTNPSDPNRDSGLPRELREVARLLDDRGMRERARLNEEAMNRIFAASDLQRPLGLDEVAPIAGRISPARRESRPLLRIAAAVAAVAGIGGVIALAVLVNRTPDRAGSEIADGGADVAPAPTPVPAGSAAPKPMLAASKQMLAASKQMLAAGAAAGKFEHLDAALEGTVTASTASRSAGAVIVALSDTRAGALAGFASADEALARELEPLFATGALLDGGDDAYDDLSAELAAVVTRTESRGASSSGSFPSSPR